MYRIEQTTIGVIEDVTVEDPRARAVVVELHEKLARFLEGDVDGVFPLQWTHGLSVLVEHLEEETVKMKGVRPWGRVFDGPSNQNIRIWNKC